MTVDRVNEATPVQGQPMNPDVALLRYARMANAELPASKPLRQPYTIMSLERFQHLSQP